MRRERRSCGTNPNPNANPSPSPNPNPNPNQAELKQEQEQSGVLRGNLVAAELDALCEGVAVGVAQLDAGHLREGEVEG